MMERPHTVGYEDLLRCGHGQYFEEGGPRLPLPDFLMVDRISHISEEGGAYGKGQIIAEKDITPDLWFFKCHFEDDPVMPGCLGVDGLWQLLGFYLGWLGHLGKGRALGSKEIKYKGEILPSAKLVTYRIDIRRVLALKLAVAVADATILCDGVEVTQVKELKTGLFRMAS